MRTIKTRNSVKNIKVLDKSISASKRMKDAYVRTKDKAEETQNPNDATPAEYASNNIQGTTQSATHETAHYFHNPRQKASENWNRAKGHFQEVKRQVPKERNRAAEQAKKTAHTAKTKATELRSTADKAGETARDAKTTVTDAKNNLRQARQSGRQTLREVKQKAKSEQSGRFIKTREYATNTTPGELPRSTSSMSGNTTTGSTPQPTSGAANAAPRSGKLPKQANPTAVRNGGVSKNAPSSPTSKTNINPARSGSTPKSAAKTPTSTNAAKTPKGGISKPDGGLNTIKGGTSSPNYMSKGVSAPKSAGDTAKTLKSSAKTTGKAAVESTKKGVKETAKGTVETAKKSVKTAEKTAKKAVKTAKQTAKTAHKTAKAAAKTAKTAERAARAAAKAAAKTAKVAAKAVAALVKSAIAAVKGLVAIIAAGGWVAVLVILIICMIGLLVGSIFGIFFSGEDNGTGRTMPSVVAELTADFYEQAEQIQNANPHDVLDMDVMSIYWPEVLAMYAVKVSTAHDGMDVATLDDERVDKLRGVLNDMITLSYTLRTDTWEHTVINDDGEEVTETETIITLIITMTQKSADDMAAQYGFNTQQKAQLYELLSPEYADLWAQLLGGYIAEDGTILTGSGSYFPKDIFTWPLENNYPISSYFGYRKDPFTHETKYHSGIDVSVPGGVPILAAADGTVIIANSTDSWGGGYGYYVKIQHGGGYATLYAHCSKIAVVNGQEVKKGLVIAYVGSTGRSTGNHLHWEVYKNGERTDPLGYFE